MEQDGNDATPVNANLLPSGLSHVKMLEGWVAPPSIVVWKSIVWRAKVRCSDGDGFSSYAPSGISFVVTNDLEALPT